MLVLSLFLLIVSTSITPSFTCWYTSYINGTRYRNAVMGYNNTNSYTTAPIGFIETNNDAILSVEDVTEPFIFFPGYQPVAFYVRQATKVKWRISETAETNLINITLLSSATSCYVKFNQSCSVSLSFDGIGIPDFCQDSFFCNGMEQCNTATQHCVSSSLLPCGVATLCSEEYLNCTDLVFTDSPTGAPTNSPTLAPTGTPTNNPTLTPTALPTNAPTSAPTGAPTNSPTLTPTAAPTTNSPTLTPTALPTGAPTNSPTLMPTIAPTGAPTETPTPFPTSAAPTDSPTNNPTPFPTISPTDVPTNAPTPQPTGAPTEAPTGSPTNSPTPFPTISPTEAPTPFPTLAPTPNATNTARPPSRYPRTPCTNNSDCRARRVALFCGDNGLCRRLRCQVDDDCPSMPYERNKCFGTICIERGNARICMPTKCDQACLPEEGCPSEMTTPLVPVSDIPGADDVDTDSLTPPSPSVESTDSSLTAFIIVFAVFIAIIMALLYMVNTFLDMRKKAPRQKKRLS